MMERNRFDAVRYYFDYDNGTRRDVVVAVVDGKELDRLVLESGADTVAPGVPYALVAPPSRHWLVEPDPDSGDPLVFDRTEYESALASL